MIKHIFSNSPLVTVSQPSVPYIMSHGLCVGQMRFNTGNNNVEVYDGNNWTSVCQTVNINVDPELDRCVKWAKDKMAEEERIRNKAKLFPSIQDALNELEKAKEQLHVLDQLCNENELDPTQNVY